MGFLVTPDISKLFFIKFALIAEKSRKINPHILQETIIFFRIIDGYIEIYRNSCYRGNLDSFIHVYSDICRI